MEKQQPEETATKEAGPADVKSPEVPTEADPKSPEPVATETPLEKDPPKEEEKSEKKDSDEASEKEEEKPLEEDAKPEKKKEGDEPERKSKEDDPDETVEEFEDAVDTVGEPDDIELPDHFRSEGGSSTRSSRRSSRRDSYRSDGAGSSDENLPRLRVTESETYEIESSPEKSPKTRRRRSTSEEESKPTPRAGPSKVKSHEDIETVDLDDDEDDYDEDRSFEEDEDDYYDDPESDDQEVNRVIQEAVDEIDAMDNPESGEEDKMDVSSDEEDDDEDYSDDDDDRQRSIVVSKGRDKRKRESDYSDGEIYDADDGDEYDQVGDVDEPEGGFRPPKSREVSLGRISLDDSDEEQEAVSPKKKVGGKVKYKSYNQKLVAAIRKRTFKILNKRSSMHVMDEGSDAATLVCSSDATATTAAKVVSLTTSSSTSSKSPAAPEEARKPVESPKEAAAAVSDLDVDKKQVVGGDENKENMTVKDNTPAATVVGEEVKAAKNDEKKKKKREESEEDVMSGMMDDLDENQDCTYRNGSKTEDFNDELAFQMDVDGGGTGEGSQKSEDTEGEDDREEGAVDLSSSTEAVNKQPVELVESSPEKEVVPVRQAEVPDLSVEKVVKVEPVEQVEEQRREESSVDLSKTSPKEKPQPEKPVSRKRRRSVEEYEDEEDAEPLVPSKKLKRELECNFRAHDRLLKEYIETTSNDSMDDVQKNTELLMVEIQTLNDMIRAKENEWNNMIHLKKVKEEILMRLTRKKNVLNLVHTKLGEEPPADYSLSNVRSASVGPRPPTPPPEVDIRPASVTPLHNSRQSANTSANDSNRQRLSQSSKDHHHSSNSLFAQFNHINSSVTMVPLSTSPSLITSTNTILQSRANMKPSELAKEKPNAAQIQRQILPKPILSNHQQILNNLAMSAGLTAATNPSPNNSTSISASTNSITAAAALAANNILANLGLSAQAAALLNGHHNPQHQSSNQLQVGRQGVIKDVKSIIADYRQKHPEQVPRRGRRLKNIPSSSYDGMKGGSSTDQRMRELSFLLAAAEDDEAEDSVDRLVIDEGDDGHHDSGHQVNHHGGHGHGHHQRSSANREPSVVITTRGGSHGHGSGNNEFHENDVPECQGCKKREAQFVCAGCGNQWYCSRECQVNAWDDHSEVCTG